MKIHVFVNYIKQERTICIYPVLLREESIRNRWKDLLQQLQEHRGLLGNVVETLSCLRDIELVSQELKELQVNMLWFLRLQLEFDL